jgi:putative PEP-CTERM system histidine kinase
LTEVHGLVAFQVSNFSPVTFTFYLAWTGAILAGFLALGVFVQGRRSAAHWFFLAGMSLLALEGVCVALTVAALTQSAPDDAAFAQQSRLWIVSVLPAAWLGFSLSYARGNAKEYLLRWCWPLVAAFVVPLAVAVVFRDGLVAKVGKDSKTLEWVIELGRTGNLLTGFFLVSLILVVMNLERTFRTAVGVMRWRIKFMVLGLILMFAVRAYICTEVLLFGYLGFSRQILNAGALVLASLMMIRSLLRSGHFEVAVYPSQQVLYNSLTVLLAGAYLVIVGVLAKIAETLGGVSAFQLKAFVVLVSLVLLTLLLMSDRVRLSTRRFISRNFQRPLYDYRTVWRTFTEGTARHVEQTSLCNAVVKLIAEIFQALSVNLWLVDERRQNLVLAASSSLSNASASRCRLDPQDADEVIRALTLHPEPVDVDESREVWAVLLRRIHPDEFRHGGNRVCVPVLTGGELLGLISLGDRVGGVPFSLQDYDLLKSVADQTAASLLNLRLSQRLSQGKQLEAFQAMSAFFVHDLKNTASTLSLMLQNLPVHYQDPQFREDALRGISKTVAHINDLINRLGLLRHELTINAVECDLNDLVAQALQAQPQTAGVELVQDFQALPRLQVDPAQIQKVVTNLVLNATEAVGPGGRIHVRTTRKNGWAILAVEDTGCGMTPEFMQSSLFRPFQTTKKKGIGIGMFHCKMIVEAHRGRIEVESQPGKGTCFRVLLPMPGNPPSTSRTGI